MPLRNIVGQHTAVRLLMSALKTDRINHAFMFEGPGGSGKRTTALALAQAVNCPNPVDHDACGVCPSCSRIERGIDVDVRVYSPVKQRYIVEEAQMIREEAGITPNNAIKKFLILDNADRSNPESANQLLKVIEEPPEFTVFVLLTENRHMVLPTIRSRTLEVSFGPLSEADAVTASAGRVSAEKMSFIHPIAGGNMGMILQLCEDKKLKEIFDDVAAELFERILANVPASPMRLAEEVLMIADRLDVKAPGDTPAAAQRKALVNILEIMTVLAERKFFTGSSRQADPEQDRPRREFAALLLRSILETIRAVKGGANPNLALEALVIGLRNSTDLSVRAAFS